VVCPKAIRTAWRGAAEQMEVSIRDVINVEKLKRESFNISNEIRILAKILSKELNLKIFGFDLIKPINLEKYYIIDLNDFPSFKGIQNAEHIISNYIKNYLFKN